MITFNAIGVIRSGFADKKDAPIQGAFSPEAEGRVELFEEFAAGLKDIEGFSHLILLYVFDRAGRAELVRKPFLDDEEHGIFAMRFPARPNPIGLSVVRLLGREGDALRVGWLDVLDKTPLLDIKPYVPRFDAVPDAREGWFAGKKARPKPEGREG